MGLGNRGGPSRFGKLPDGGMGGEASLLFLNNGEGTLKDVTREAGISYVFDARGTTLAHYDEDGLADIVVADERGQGNSNHWLKVQLAGTRTNRDARGFPGPPDLCHTRRKFAAKEDNP